HLPEEKEVDGPLPRDARNWLVPGAEYQGLHGGGIVTARAYDRSMVRHRNARECRGGRRAHVTDEPRRGPGSPWRDRVDPVQAAHGEAGHPAHRGGATGGRASPPPACRLAVCPRVRQPVVASP